MYHSQHCTLRLRTSVVCGTVGCAHVDCVHALHCAHALRWWSVDYAWHFLLHLTLPATMHLAYPALSIYKPLYFTTLVCRSLLILCRSVVNVFTCVSTCTGFTALLLRSASWIIRFNSISASYFAEN